MWSCSLLLCSLWDSLPRYVHHNVPGAPLHTALSFSVIKGGNLVPSTRTEVQPQPQPDFVGMVYS